MVPRDTFIAVYMMSDGKRDRTCTWRSNAFLSLSRAETTVRSRGNDKEEIENQKEKKEGSRPPFFVSSRVSAGRSFVNSPRSKQRPCQRGTGALDPRCSN